MRISQFFLNLGAKRHSGKKHKKLPPTDICLFLRYLFLVLDAIFSETAKTPSKTACFLWKKGPGTLHLVTKSLDHLSFSKKKELGKTQKLKNSRRENAVSKAVCEFLSYENSTPKICRVFVQPADQKEPRKRWNPLG